MADPTKSDTNTDWFYELLRPSDAPCPESRLFRAVVVEAFISASRPVLRRSNLHSRRNHEDALAWILHGEDFLTICDWAGLDGEMLRQVAGRRLAALPARQVHKFLGVFGGGASRGQGHITIGRQNHHRRTKARENP